VAAPFADAALLAALQDPTVSITEIAALVDGLPEAVVQTMLATLGTGTNTGVPSNPAEQAVELDAGYMLRDHLVYLSDRLAVASADVKNGTNRLLVISMPPRSGKSLMASVYTPLWMLRHNPEWKLGLISHDPSLATLWGRSIRNTIEQNPDLGLAIAADAGAASEWQTIQRGGVTSRSAPGQSITGRGFKVMIIDDIVKDFASAHSDAQRQAIWDWWIANAQTRLEPPHLVIVIGTRWHEDDFIGRLLSKEYDGDPRDWEVISFPAIAEEADALGRQPGEPLLSPLIPDETKEDALVRWAGVKRSVGTYSWASLFQQRPAPAEGAVFDIGWWRFWTTDEALVTDDGKTRLLDFTTLLGARWLDSWDMAFKATKDSDYVVGQRWCRHGANRFLIDQRRGRWTFTQTVRQMKDFGIDGMYSSQVHQRLVEDKANGTAILDSLKDEIAGLKAINPTTSKEARARAITPEVESGNVYLPHPTQFPWVYDLLAELRAFPTGAHDDQVDALTQGLSELREPQKSSFGRPSTSTVRINTNRATAARTQIRRSPGG
jgi:predicted phage terminase large subunit-like protein